MCKRMWMLAVCALALTLLTPAASAQGNGNGTTDGETPAVVAPEEKTLLTIYVQPDDPEKRFDLSDADLSLFRPLPKAAESPSLFSEGGDDPMIKRQSRVQVNLENLDTAKTVALKLFDDRIILAIFERLEVRSETGYTWYGRVLDGGLSSVVLTVEDGHLAGVIESDLGTFQISPDGASAGTASEGRSGRAPAVRGHAIGVASPSMGDPGRMRLRSTLGWTPCSARVDPSAK